MKTNLMLDFEVDRENSTILVKREFAAPLAAVWAAWTQRELLDQWWAPKPWKARTKTMNFMEGGHWLYAMVGPNGEEHWARADYDSIVPMQGFSGLDAFCDAEGNLNTEFPRSHWSNTFSAQGETTTVSMVIRYSNLADLEKIIEMGFREGFTSAMENLDAIFASA